MTNNPSPTTIFKLYLQFELPLVGFPSGQREQTVNLPSSTSKVRFERSEKALPQATTRRVKRAALSNPLLICNVIRYNANDNPTKQTAFSQYDRPQARRRYAEIADHLGLSAPGDRTAAKIEKLLAWLESIKAELGIPKSIREAGVQEADFLAHVDKLSEDAFDDQCTGANPRYPLVSELRQLLLASFYGEAFAEQ